MSRARTVENFPRMKVRGGKRRRDAAIENYWRTVDTIDFSAIGRAIAGLGTAFAEFGRRMADFADAVSRIFVQVRLSYRVAWWLAQRRARDQWLSRRMLTASPSPWAAPMRSVNA